MKRLFLLAKSPHPTCSDYDAVSIMLSTRFIHHEVERTEDMGRAIISDGCRLIFDDTGTLLRLEPAR